MVGMVINQEADIALGPFVMSEARAAVVDLSMPVVLDYLRLLSVRGKPQVNPWGLFLPFRPLVWAGMAGALLVAWAASVLVMMQPWVSLASRHHMASWRPYRIFFEHIRALLQQDCELRCFWGWERLVFASWLMVTNVLLWSYGGNLTSLLAVRSVPQPLQTLADLLVHPSIIAVFEQDTAYSQLLKNAESGIFVDLALLEEQKRIRYVKTTEFHSVVTDMKKGGDYALIIEELGIRNLMADDVSKTGHCDLYISREKILPSIKSIITYKDSPLLEAFNVRIHKLTTSGLYMHWLKEAMPNFTTCSNLRPSITVQEPIAVSNIWGVFMMLASGLVLSSVIFCLELMTARYYSSDGSRSRTPADSNQKAARHAFANRRAAWNASNNRTTGNAFVNRRAAWGASDNKTKGNAFPKQRGSVGPSDNWNAFVNVRNKYLRQKRDSRGRLRNKRGGLEPFVME
nr:glutamate receptor ionotropic, delta-1-like [Cherax quadricarinatus]